MGEKRYPEIYFSKLTDDGRRIVNAEPQKKAGRQHVKPTTQVLNAGLVSADKVYVPAATPKTIRRRRTYRRRVSPKGKRIESTEN
jgi:hypothetical protein